MRPTLFRMGALALSFIVGVTISLFFTNHRSEEGVIPAVANKLCAREDWFYKSESVVISVPNDAEFYIGRQKVEPSQISVKITQLLGNVCLCDRVVFIKSAAKVKFQTLNLIVSQAKNAGVNRIEFVLDKKKRGAKL